mmetsp:Transcript_33293/g.80490  ORF Transcript_33293/g.80490 Transcript_33293/m.80490 type:complete len:205 (-) Transcript_33293:463-1077(-)
MTMGMVPVLSLGMVIWYVQFVTVTFTWIINLDVRGIRVMGTHWIKHICGPPHPIHEDEGWWNQSGRGCRSVNHHAGWIVHGLLVISVLDGFSGVLKSDPVVCSSGWIGTNIPIGTIHFVGQLDPQGLTRFNPHRRAHKGRFWYTFDAMDVTSSRFVEPPAIRVVHQLDGFHSCDKIIIHITSIAWVITGNKVCTASCFSNHTHT